MDVVFALKEAENVDIHATTNTGRNSTHIAAQEGHLDLLRVLKGWDIDCHAPTNDGFTTVHLAARQGRHPRPWLPRPHFFPITTTLHAHTLTHHHHNA